MLKMAQQQYIKHLYEVEERSLNEIAEMTGFNFRTVQKYAYQDNWSVDHLPDVEPGSYPVLGDFIPVIDLWLEEDRRVPESSVTRSSGSMTGSGMNAASPAATPVSSGMSAKRNSS